MDNSKDITPSVDSGLFDGLFDSATGIILVVLIVFILMLILFFLFKRFKFKHQMNKERRSLKEDLMIWSNLANLVSGGKKRKQGKEDLTADVKIAKLILESAVTYIKTKCYKKQRTPWYIILGEPLSGKSSILKDSTLGYDQSRRELDLKDEECLHVFVSKGNVFLDVKGKTFFDTWLGGSSAQWEVICEQIKKYHHNKPLSGVVLTIPADALIADDRELTIKKANLIASELHKLSSTVCMNLPCKVVITKCDCVVGFREYFSSFSDEMREQVLGLDLSNDDGFYDEELFYNSWSNFIERLKSGAVSLLSSREVSDKSYTSENRLDSTAYIFTFPEHMNYLRHALEIYLKNIFERTGSFKPNLIEGVYFTSATDQGVCLDPEYAAHENKAVDEALLVDENKVSEKSFFIKQLFLKLIPDMNDKAVFTKRERLIRNIPVVALCTVLTVLSLNYLTGALMGRELIYDRLHSDVIFYKNLNTMFDRGYIGASPLIDIDKNGRGYNSFNELMAGNSRNSRLNFFTESKSRLIKDVSLPFIYFPSSYLLADFNNLKKEDRHTIYNQLLVNMVFSPAASNFALDLLRRDDPFTEKKADALFSYLFLAIARTGHDVEGIAILENSIKKILAYQYPDISPKILADLTQMSCGDDDYAKAAATEILLDPNYAPSVNHGLKVFMNQLSKIEAFPESKYQVIKQDLNSGAFLVSVYKRLYEFAFNYSDKVKDEDYLQEYQELQALIKKAIKISSELDKTAAVFLHDYASPVIKSSNSSDKAEKVTVTAQRTMLVDAAYRSYRKIVTDDYKSFIEYVEQSNASGADMVEDVVLSGEVMTSREDTLNNLDKDRQKLDLVMKTVNNSRIFDKTVNEKDGMRLNYQLLSEMLNIADTSNLNLSLDSTADFIDRYNQLNVIFADKYKALDNFDSQNTEDSKINALTKSIKSYLKFSEFTCRMQLANALLDKYPASSSKGSNLTLLAEAISNSKEFDYDEYLSTALAKEALGYFEVADEFSPSAVHEFINPIATLESFKNVKLKDNNASDNNSTAQVKSIVAFNSYISKSKKVKQVSALIEDYADKFINYWGNFADSLKPYAQDYASFHDFALDSKAYQINSQLSDIYNFSYDLLSSIKDEPLSAKTKKTKAQLLSLIDDRRKALSLNFTQACTNVLNSWAMLPEDPVKANHFISALDKKSVRNDYTTVRNLNSAKGNIPWWTSFVNLGTTLLKSEASYQTATGLEEFQSKLYFFPVLKDAATDAMALRYDDMPLLNRRLKSYSIVKSKESDLNEPKIEESADEGVDNLQEPLLNNVMAGRNDIRQWASAVSRILTDVGDRKNKLEFTLSIPSMEKQEELRQMSGILLPSAVVTMRYVSIKSTALSSLSSSLSTVQSSRFSTAVEAGERKIVNSDVANGNFEFQFYRYSDSNMPDTTYKVKGNYAALRMYLNDRAIYSDKEHCSYVPLIVSNRGDESVLFVKVSFNKELLRPDDWPDSQNWPSITMF